MEDAGTGELVDDEIVELISNKKLLKLFPKARDVTVTFWYQAPSPTVNGPSAACPLTCGPVVGVGVTVGQLQEEVRRAEQRIRADAQAQVDYCRAEARTAVVTAGAREMENYRLHSEQRLRDLQAFAVAEQGIASNEAEQCPLALQ